MGPARLVNSMPVVPLWNARGVTRRAFPKYVDVTDWKENLWQVLGLFGWIYGLWKMFALVGIWGAVFFLMFLTRYSTRIIFLSGVNINSYDLHYLGNVTQVSFCSKVNRNVNLTE